MVGICSSCDMLVSNILVILLSIVIVNTILAVY